MPNGDAMSVRIVIWLLEIPDEMAEENEALFVHLIKIFTKGGYCRIRVVSPTTLADKTPAEMLEWLQRDECSTVAIAVEGVKNGQGHFIANNTNWPVVAFTADLNTKVAEPLFVLHEQATAAKRALHLLARRCEGLRKVLRDSDVNFYEFPKRGDDAKEGT